MRFYLLYLFLPYLLFAQNNYFGFSSGYSLAESDRSADGSSHYFLRVGHTFDHDILHGIEFVYGDLDSKENCCTDVDTQLFSLNVLWHIFDHQRTEGYLITGIGYQKVKKPLIEYDVDIVTAKYQDSTLGTLGAGFTYHLSENFDLRAEAIAYMPFDGSETHTMVQLGVDIPFGDQFNLLTNSKQASMVNILFETGKAKIEPIFYPRLDEYVRTLKKYPNSKMQIIGHTDSIASRAYNRILSRQRANAVKHYIVSKGIARSRIRTVGRGEGSPVADNSTEAGRRLNRRIEAKIYR